VSLMRSVTIYGIDMFTGQCRAVTTTVSPTQVRSIQKADTASQFNLSDARWAPPLYLSSGQSTTHGDQAGHLCFSQASVSSPRPCP
jgi:hypothetical protein